MNENGSRDYYKILGVDPGASPQQIKEAFRRLALEHHPDRNQDNPEATARMAAVNEAYAVLSDPVKRREYDEIRSRFGPEAYGRFRQNYSQEDIFRGSDIQSVFDEMSRTFGYRSFEDLFKEFARSGGRTFDFGGPGYRGKGWVFTSRPVQNRGSSSPLLNRGIGKMLSYGLRKTLGVHIPERGPDRHDTITIAPEEAEQGGKIPYNLREFSKTLLVGIPAGFPEGGQLRLKGMGGPGKGGGEAGDLYLKVRLRKPLMQKISGAVQRFLGTIAPKDGSS